MLKKILGLLLAGLLALVVLLLFNTFRARPWPQSDAFKGLAPLPDSALQHLSEAIRCPTVSFSDSSAIDTAAFRAFGAVLEKAYPLVHQRLQKTLINGFSLVFEWPGREPALAPIILMGHYDVVPVEPAALDRWILPPFSGRITDSCVWGRGSVDDKCGVISTLEAAESLLQSGFVPRRTLFLCFGHDEEISGRSARAVVDYLQKKNIHPEMVLDEGGEITEEKIKEIHRPVAVIGVAEKGYASYELAVEKEGGHSSMPDHETAISILVAALQRLDAQPSPSRLTPPVREFLQRIGSSSDNFTQRLAAANMWLFAGVAKGIIGKTREGNAMIHTTLVPTILQAGVKDNVIPGNARAIINSRILPGETAATVKEYIRQAITDDRVKIREIGRFGSDPSPGTPTTSAAYRRVESALYKTVDRILPTPYLMVGATDSRHYRRLSPGVVNFLPMTDSKGFHGINERLPIRDLQRSIHFMRTLIMESNQDF